VRKVTQSRFGLSTYKDFTGRTLSHQDIVFVYRHKVQWRGTCKVCASQRLLAEIRKMEPAWEKVNELKFRLVEYQGLVMVYE